MNIAGNLTKTTADNPDSVAIKLDDLEMTFAQLDGASSLAAGWLRDLGVGPGDRVGIMLPNIPQFPILYYEVLHAGGIVVPMNPLFKEREVEYYLTDSGAKVLFAWEGVPDQAQPGAEAAGAAYEVVDAGFMQRLASHAPAPEVVDRAPVDDELVKNNECHARVRNRLLLLRIRQGDEVTNGLPLLFTRALHSRLIPRHAENIVRKLIHHIIEK